MLMAVMCAIGSTSKTFVLRDVLHREHLEEKYNIGGNNEQANLLVIDSIIALFEEMPPATESSALKKRGVSIHESALCMPRVSTVSVLGPPSSSARESCGFVQARFSVFNMYMIRS